jgi:F-type H+-transporting ATPase subunit delta
MDHSQVANVYASALLEIAVQKKSTDEFQMELKSFLDTLKGDGDVWSFLMSPRIKKAQKIEIIEKSFSGKASNEVINLICILIRNDRISSISEIYLQYRNLNDKFKGLIRAKVFTAHELPAEEIQSIKNWFNSAYKSSAEIETYIKPELIGGVVIQFQDKIIDGSISNKLKLVREAIVTHSNENLISNKNTGAYYED